MCGLVGFINNEKAHVPNLANCISQLLYIDMFRGDDATGFAGILKGDQSKYMMYKRALRAPDFLETKGWEKAYKKIQDMKYFIGHNRKATVGDSWLDANAHPFHQNNIILAHNGSLKNEYQLMTNWRDKVGTDSELLALMLNTQTPEELLPKVNGAFALTWYDSRDKTMNFVRNDERPFHMATIKGKNLLIWASEHDMLEYVITRNNLEAESIDTLVDGWHVKITDDVREWDETAIEFYTPPVTRGHRAGGNSSYPDTGGRQTTIHVRANSSVRTQNKLLAQHHLSPGQWVKFSYMNFTPYRSPGYKTGTLFGIPYGNNHIANCYIQCHNFDPTEFTMNCAFRGKVKRIVPDKHTDTPTIYLEDVEELPAVVDDSTRKSFLADVAGIKGYEDIAQPRLPIIYHEKEDSFTDLAEEPEEIRNIAGHSVSPGRKDKRRKYRGPDGNFFRLKDFRKLVSDGCMYCTGAIVASDSDGLLWTNDDRAICSSCAERHRNGEIDLSGYIKQ